MVNPPPPGILDRVINEKPAVPCLDRRTPAADIAALKPVFGIKHHESPQVFKIRPPIFVGKFFKIIEINHLYPGQHPVDEGEFVIYFFREDKRILFPQQDIPSLPVFYILFKEKIPLSHCYWW